MTIFVCLIVLCIDEKVSDHVKANSGGSQSSSPQSSREVSFIVNLFIFSRSALTIKINLLIVFLTKKLKKKLNLQELKNNILLMFIPLSFNLKFSLK